jgi:hypothetical protein
MSENLKRILNVVIVAPTEKANNETIDQNGWCNNEICSENAMNRFIADILVVHF